MGASKFVPGLTSHSIDVGGQTREFLLYLPVDCPEQAPLIIALHGAGSSAEAMVDFCGMNSAADEYGFFAVYPQGSGRDAQARSWNAGAVNVWAARHHVDDVGFMHTLIDYLLDQTTLDEHRVYATGMSNGGLLCFLLGCEMPERLAAIAPVAVSLVDLSRRPGIPMPLIHFHGTEDHFVPYEGGLGRKSLTRTAFVGVEKAMRFWAEANGCRERTVTQLPPVVSDGTRVTRYQYVGGHADVVHYQIHGGGHTWPGQPCDYAFLGTVSQNLLANKTIWEFFRTKRR